MTDQNTVLKQRRDKKDLSKFSHSVFLCVLFNYIHGDLGFHKAFTQGLKEGEVAEGFSP